MDTLQTVLLGLIQGLTEFLPVSSSAHLVIFQNFLGLKYPGITLEVILHFGTLLSVFWVFGRDFVALLRFPRDAAQRRLLLLLILGCIPTAIIGLLLSAYVDAIFDSALFAGIMLLVTGGMLKGLTLLAPGKKTIGEMKAGDSLMIGLFQGIAILPGISRSGSTITGAVWRGLDRETAVKFSFMLAAPAILGATLLEAKDVLETGIEKALIFNYLLGGLVAFVAGILAIRFFIRLLQEHKFHYFAYYCWGAGLLTIVLSLWLA